MGDLFKNRPLSQGERNKLNDGEQKVITHFERVTGCRFMRYDVPLLKRCVKAATPEAVNQLISQLYQRYPNNFTDFNYIVMPATNGMLKRSRGGRSGSDKKDGRGGRRHGH